MLAVIRQPPLPEFHASLPSPSRNMSVTLLPSNPIACGQSSLHNAFPTSPSSSRRPKLSLNTSNVTAGFGKVSTSLRLETLSATSPTARNTFQNRDTAKSQKPVLTPLVTATPKLLQSPSSTTSQTPAASASLISPECRNFTESPITSTTPVANVDIFPSELPYTLPSNTTSILVNGPTRRTSSRGSSYSSHSETQAAAPKAVGFRAPLTEEIETTRYVLKHSDLCESPTVISKAECASYEAEIPTNEHTQLPSSTAEDKARRIPHSGSKRDSLDLEGDKTPVAGRAKRQKWVWTIEPGHLDSERQDHGT